MRKNGIPTGLRREVRVLIEPLRCFARIRNLLSFTLATASALGHAHHGGEFQRDREVTYTAVVKEFRLVNPHSYIVVEEPRDDGTIMERVVTLGSASGFIRSGRLSRESIRPGDTLTITGAPAIVGYNSTGHEITRDDGTVVLSMRPAQSDDGGRARSLRAGAHSDFREGGRPANGADERDAPATRQSSYSTVQLQQMLTSEGIWTARRPNFLATAPDDRLTASALEKRRNFDSLKDDPLLDCGVGGLPRRITMGGPIGFSWQGDVLTIGYGDTDVVRTVHMNHHVAPPDTPTSPFGYSVGFWEGNTLVVETSRLDDRVQDLVGTPKGGATRLTERYRLDTPDNPDDLLLELTVTDSEVFHEPYRWNFTYSLDPDWEPLGIRCEPVPR